MVTLSLPLHPSSLSYFKYRMEEEAEEDMEQGI